ncbi:DUF2790 domain-containing protein [Pseudomonas putida]|uniref:DUF2790 domain-containing protein n=1 Tax=Pseudomonas putida TaxID=303 RepID=A0A6I6XL85_PSEPU|nr:DUF2790 domain-containing protein [Pseudomonas putida]QHG64636.1 DUF2790 domain-containing protein [Pseudomonas putida]
MKTLLAIAALTLAGQVFAGQPVSNMNSSFPSAPQDYSYSMDLDIAKVISMTSEGATDCGIIPATLIYADHEGQVHAIKYHKQSYACLGENG